MLISAPACGADQKETLNAVGKAMISVKVYFTLMPPAELIARAIVAIVLLTRLISLKQLSF